MSVSNSQEIEQRVIQSSYEQWPMNKWRKVLSKQCEVYVYGVSYLAKRFDSIAYEFCSAKTATVILEDNLYALLKYKYFILQDDETDRLIHKIVKTFCENLKTTLTKVSFQREMKEGTKVIKDIPPYCVAFRNGVFNFKNNKWLFEIRKTPMKTILNTLYEYNDDYVILWYLDFEFDSLDINLEDLDGEMILSIFKDNESTNYAFNLVHNMSFSEEHIFSMKKFEHLSEILGFTLSSQFIQNFILFIGTGSNGKNSLLDGCFSNFLAPKPTSISLSSIEDDKFVTGALENHYHNFYLESTGKTYNKTEVLKSLTGSTQQSIERKGDDRRTGYLNVKHIFSGNDRDKIKFGDSTTGFNRRINLFEVFYKWDSSDGYLQIGDYLRANFSPDLRELTMDIINPITYVYLGMWGMMKATKGFTMPFKFSHNDYNTKYEDIDTKIKTLIYSFTTEDLVKMMISPDGDTTLIIDSKRLYLHPKFRKHFYLEKKDGWRKCVNDLSLLIEFLEDKVVWLNLSQLRAYSHSILTQANFNQEIEKILKAQFKAFSSGQKYIRVKIIGKKLKFL